MRNALLAKRGTLFGAALLGLATLSPSAASAAAITLENATTATTTTRALIATAGPTAITGATQSPLYDYPALAGGAAGNNNLVNGVLAPYAAPMGGYAGSPGTFLTIRYAAAISAGSPMTPAYTPVGPSASAVSISQPNVTGSTGKTATASITAVGPNSLVCVAGNLAVVPTNAGSISAGATATPVLIQVNAGAGPIATGGTALAANVSNLPVGCGDTRKTQLFTSNSGKYQGGKVVDTIAWVFNHKMIGGFQIANIRASALNATFGIDVPALSAPVVFSPSNPVLNPIPSSALQLTINNVFPFAFGSNDTGSTSFSIFNALSGSVSAMTYSDVWNTSTGTLLLATASIPNLPVPTDAAQPIPISVTRVQTGPDAGALVIQFSEAVQSRLPMGNALPASLASAMSAAGYATNVPMNGVLPASAIRTASGNLAGDSVSNNLTIQNQGWGVPCANSQNLPPNNPYCGNAGQSAATVVFDFGFNGNGAGQQPPNAGYLNSSALGLVGLVDTTATNGPAGPYSSVLQDANGEPAFGIPAPITSVAFPAPFTPVPAGFYATNAWPALNAQGQISDILVFLNQPPKTPSPTNLSDLAAATSFNIGGRNYTPTGATVSGAVIDFTLPSPINPKSFQQGTLFGNAFYFSMTPTLLASSDGSTTLQSFNNSINFFAISASGAGSEGVLTQTITGNITRAGLAAPSTVIRADVATFTAGRRITAARASVPVLAGGNKTVATDVPLQFSQNLSLPFSKGASGASNDPYSSPESLLAYLDQAALAGQTSIRGYVNLFVQSGAVQLAVPSAQPVNSLSLQFSQGLSGNPSGAGLPPVQSYEIQVSTASGAIAGAAGDTNVAGQFVIEKTRPSLKLLNQNGAYFAIADKSGNYRLSIGQESLSPSEAFVLLSVLEAPGIDKFGNPIPWKLATYADPSLANYLKFRPDIGTGTATSTPGTTFTTATNAGGANGATVQNIDLALIGSANVKTQSSGWQLLGLPGNIARSPLAFVTGPFKSSSFLVGANPGDGSVVSYWFPVQTSQNYQPRYQNVNNNTLNSAQPALESFTLSGNGVKSDFSFNNGGASVFNIGGGFTSGLGLAVNTGTNGSGYNQAYGFNQVTNTVVSGAYVHYPLSATAFAPGALPAGWSLITYEGTSNQDPAQLSVAGTPSAPVSMIILADDADQTQTWIKGAATQNTLQVLQPGRAYFVFLPTAATAFTYK